MDETLSRALISACQLFSDECLPSYDPYAPNVLTLVAGVLCVALVVLGAQELTES